MSYSLFISDVHLCQEECMATRSFFDFLGQDKSECDALYILGDLFEVWIGDDEVVPLYQEIARRICALPVPVYFIHGNRDLLLGKYFSKASNMLFLPEVKVLNLYGSRLIILHGDILCTNDKRYQYFRTYVHQRWLQSAFLSLPLLMRKLITYKIRSISQNSRSKPTYFIDIDQNEVIKIMRSADAQYMIHGHTHQPEIHAFSIDCKTSIRASLGAWHTYSSAISFDSSGVRLVNFRVD